MLCKSICFQAECWQKIKKTPFVWFFFGCLVVVLCVCVFCFSFLCPFSRKRMLIHLKSSFPFIYADEILKYFHWLQQRGAIFPQPKHERENILCILTPFWLIKSPAVPPNIFDQR